MGRKRKKAYQHLPPRFYVERKRIVYKEPGCKSITVGSADMQIYELWEEHRKLTTSDDGSLGYIATEYHKSPRFLALKSGKESHRNLDKALTIIGIGKMPEQIQPVTLRDYLDVRGKESITAANREIAAVSAMWSWAREYGYIELPNPCKGVRRHTENPRTRYVNDIEFKQAYQIMPKHIQVAMELAYLCRMRLSEVLDARVKDIEPEGLNTRRLKGSDDALTLWSPRLDKAVNTGLQGCIRTPEMTIVNRNGSPVRRSSFQTTWQRRMKDFKPRFSYHDLKAKGVSDFDGDKKKASGHKSERMVRVYDRSRNIVESTK